MEYRVKNIILNVDEKLTESEIAFLRGITHMIAGILENKNTYPIAIELLRDVTLKLKML